MSSISRHCTPVYVSGQNEVTALRRSDRSEAFVQNLVNDHPELIPIQDIEPAFMPMISVCTELPTGAGYLDNLWLTPSGGIVLGECKLVRNTQARREVVVQALDYARAITGWRFDDLEAAVRKARRQPSFSLWELAKNGAEDGEAEDEAAFIDAVDRRLRSGRFVLLMILDGVQESLEALTSYLQLHAGLHMSIALVELSIWQGQDGGQLVIPRVPLRTVLVERGIVTVDARGVPNVSEARPAGTSKIAAPARPYTASEPEFYDRLETKLPGIGGQLRSFVADLEEIGIFPEYGQTLTLRWHPSEQIAASAAFIEITGAVWLGKGWGSAKKLGNPDAGRAYVDEVARQIGGSIKWSDNPNSDPFVRASNGKVPNISDLLNYTAQWKAAIVKLIEATAKTSDQD